jgi:hypothetical protein
MSDVIKVALCEETIRVVLPDEPSFVEWILVFGYWEDNYYWVDTEQWND